MYILCFSIKFNSSRLASRLSVQCLVLHLWTFLPRGPIRQTAGDYSAVSTRNGLTCPNIVDYSNYKTVRLCTNYFSLAECLSFNNVIWYGILCTYNVCMYMQTFFSNIGLLQIVFDCVSLLRTNKLIIAVITTLSSYIDQ